jgi:hypothetical protein
VDAHRVRGRLSSISWIPDESVTGLVRATFDRGITHYDQPPPDRIDDPTELDAWAAEDRFRFANRLSVWADVEDGVIVDAGYDDDSGVVMGGSTLQLGPWSTRLAAIPLPAVREPPVLLDRGDPQLLQPGRGGAERVRFTQAAGGRAAMPAPRRVVRGGVRVLAPLVWTTLSLTVAADGRIEWTLAGASRFPRHWVYDPDGVLARRTGVADFDAWYHGTTVETTPWGGDDTPVLTAAVESAMERDLTRRLLRDRGPLRPREVPAGTVVTRQGEPGGAVALLLDGLLEVQVDGEVLGELGPGVIIGERAVLEGGTRTATLTALTPVRLAVVDADRLDVDALRALSGEHRREELRRERPADRQDG